MVHVFPIVTPGESYPLLAFYPSFSKDMLLMKLTPFLGAAALETLGACHHGGGWMREGTCSLPSMSLTLLLGCRLAFSVAGLLPRVLCGRSLETGQLDHW